MLVTVPPYGITVVVNCALALMLLCPETTPELGVATIGLYITTLVGSPDATGGKVVVLAIVPSYSDVSVVN